MKILFVVQNVEYIDQIGIMLLSALAKKRGDETYLGILSRENIIKKIEAIKPDIVAYSSSTGEHKYFVEANKAIKARYPDIFTVMGGPHTTFFPQSIQETTLDAVCVGEGDEAFPELLTAVEQRKDITGIINIVTKRSSKPGDVDVRPLFADLDKLPFPDRDIFYKNTEMGDWPLRSFMASRGCPYNCTYCFNHVFHKLYRGKGQIVRRHSVDYVIEEVERVKKTYRTDVVKFYDDIFTYKADDWLVDFSAKYKKRIGLPFHCLTRADLMTEEIAKLLKQAGCFSISMSIEAGNPEMRNKVLKRGMSNEQIIRGFHICHKYGIHTFSNNILGLPYASLKNEMETIDLNLKAKASFVEFPIFHPYPRTELGDFCIEKNIYKPDYAGLHMSYMNKSPITSFTEKEKNIQRNLSTLGLLVIWMPFLRKPVMKWLIYLPYNKVYFLAYYLAKVYLNETRIYPIKFGPKRFFETLKKSLRLETFKKFDETKRPVGEKTS